MIRVLMVGRSDCDWSVAGSGSSLYPDGGPEDRGFKQDCHKSGMSDKFVTRLVKEQMSSKQSIREVRDLR